MLKHSESLEEIDIPSWEIPKLGIFHEIQLDVSKYAQYPHKYSVSTIIKSIIRHNKFTLLMLKHTISLEISDIPSLEMPHLGIFP